MIENIKTVKILLVEDFAFTSKMEAEILRELGFSNIAEAADGAEALRKLEESEDFGLIISDWNMPGMNGYELLKAVRSGGSHRETPFVMATAQSEMDKAKKALEAGADGFVTKPFTARDLEEVIVSVFSRRMPEAGRGKAARSPEPAEMTVAHLQITDHLTLGVLNHLTDTERFRPSHFRLKTRCMPSWQSVQKALEKEEVDAAFLLAPLAMDLFSAGIPLKLVLLSHRNGSVCVKNTANVRRETLHEYFKSKVFFLPHTMSVHHMLSYMFLNEIGLTLGPVGRPGANVFFEVVPPVKMPEFLSLNPDACGFAVAEPFGSKAIGEGISELMFYSGDLWKDHPCCVAVMRREFIRRHPDAVNEFVQMLVQSGQYIHENPSEAAKIAVPFLDPESRLGLDAPLMERILTMPAGLRTDNLFPNIEELDRIQRYMHETMGIGKMTDLEKLLDLRFAEEACGSGFRGRGTDMQKMNPAGLVADIIRRNIAGGKPVGKAEAAVGSPNYLQVVKEDSQIGFTLSSDLKLVNRVIRETKSFIEECGFTVFSGINLILRELLINAVEHGNKNRPEKQIRCVIRHMRDNLFKITVEDEGDGFDHASLNMAVPPGSAQIRKRGYPFIHAFSEGIEFNGAGNRVSVFHMIDMDTRFDTEKKNDRMTITPSGDITASEIEEFRSLLKRLTDEGHTRFRFDLSRVNEIDSVGLSAFIILGRMLSHSEGPPDLEIAGANRDISELFRMAHMDESFRIL